MIDLTWPAETPEEQVVFARAFDEKAVLDVVILSDKVKKKGSAKPRAMTVRDLVTDEVLLQTIERKARKDAGAGVYDAPHISGTTYADQLFSGAREQVYALAHSKRAARLARIKAAA